MQVTPEIAFRNVSQTPEIERAIEEGILELEEVEDRITACRVMVELPQHRHQVGNPYHVRIDLTLPGAEILVSRPPTSSGPDQAVVAIADAFDKARRQLLERARKRRAEQEEPYEPPPVGTVVRLFSAEGYGFLRTAVGGEVYFHENSVKGNGFSVLEVGSRVRFSQEMGDKGPQASAVIPLDARLAL